MAYTSDDPVGSSLAKKASNAPPPFSVWNAPGVSGKVAAVEEVTPPTYAFPAPSTSIPRPSSVRTPPRKVA